MSQPVVKKCTCEVTPENKARFQRFMDTVQSRGDQALVNQDTILVTRIRYVVIPLTTAGNISEAQIQAQHNVININFQNFTSTQVPQTTRYPYESIMSSPRIAFEPLNSSEVTEANGTILRMNTPSSPPTAYDNVTDLENEFVSQGGTVEAGYIYVYISTLTHEESGLLLGVAKDIISNACAIHYGTVGSSSTPGTIANYGAGKTLVHELGHCFGLYHPFSLSTCESSLTAFIHSQNPQSPLQINPNELTDLSAVTASNDNGLDNRGRDELRFCTGSETCEADTTNGLLPGDTTVNAAYSCATRAELADSTTPFETFMIFMDYGDDDTMQGFPSFTVNTMRTVIVNNTDLFDAAEIPNTSVSPVFPDTTTGSGFPTWAIVVIAVVGGLLVIGLIAYFAVKAKKSNIKPLAAYSQPFFTKKYL